MTTETLADPRTQPRSIYAGTPVVRRPCPKARGRRRERARSRLFGDVDGRPRVVFDRAQRMQEILRSSATQSSPGSPLDCLVDAVRSEVEALEAWAARRSAAEREAGPAVRRALELLRVYGRLAVLDFSSISDDERPALVTWLALEHRWCYAAAGTDREAFKRATGRTGAR